MIEVEGLVKYYGSRLVVDHLTFHAEKGEILGFLGPNGAGKTTTMRILTGYLPPNAGSVKVAGFDVLEQSIEARKRLGYLPETVPLYTDMNVFEYLKFMGDLHRVPNVDDRVDEVLEMVHMADRYESLIGNLSKGMRQRVGLAQAILHKPDVLILDEPTIGLDPVQIVEVRNIIRELGKEHTVLLSTHILTEAQQVCNRVMIINKGKIVAEDTPERLQSSLTGSKRYAVTVGGNAEGLDSLVGAVAGVTRVVPNQQGGLEFETNAGADVRAQVTRSVVQAGYDLLEFRPVGMSLEEIFVELTRTDPEDLDVPVVQDEAETEVDVQ